MDEIAGEPAGIYGVPDDGKDDIQLEFLVYGIPMEELDRISTGKEYRVHWIEAICYMEPFDDGYQRRYVAYKIE